MAVHLYHVKRGFCLQDSRKYLNLRFKIQLTYLIKLKTECQKVLLIMIPIY